MKKFLAVLMVLVALLAVQASAEPLPYMGQVAQTRYVNLYPLTIESYPEVCITPYYLHSIYEYQSKEPRFLRFPCPEGTLVHEISYDSAYFVDITREREYGYAMSEQASFELFLNQCTDESLILADGSEGYAIYLNPSENEANILVAVNDIARGVKLQIRLADGMMKAMTDQQKIPQLTAWAQGEVQRVMSSMRVERMDTYWSAGRYAGISLLNPKNPGEVVTYTIPEMPEIAGQPKPVAFITDVDDSQFEIYVTYAKGIVTEIKIAISDNYSYVESKREDDPTSVFDMTTPDGSTYGVYMHWYNLECSTAYASRVIGTYTPSYSDTARNVYLTMSVSLNGSYWTTVDGCTEDMQKLVSGFQVTTGNATPMYFDVPTYSATNTADQQATVIQTPITPVPATATPAPAPATDVPGVGSDSSFTFRNGLHWGMTPEEVLATEKKLAFQSEQPVSDRVIGRILTVKLSKFDVRGVYFFVDNQLAAVEFFYVGSQNGDATYLGNALQSVYGETEKNAPVLKQLATAIIAVRGKLDGYANAAYSWLLPSGTAIQLFDLGGGFDLFYADATVDIDTALAPVTPTPIPYDTYGL